MWLNKKQNGESEECLCGSQKDLHTYIQYYISGWYIFSHIFKSDHSFSSMTMSVSEEEKII